MCISQHNFGCRAWGLDFGIWGLDFGVNALAFRFREGSLQREGGQVENNGKSNGKRKGHRNGNCDGKGSQGKTWAEQAHYLGSPAT